MDEVFFPEEENSNRGIGSCFKIKPNGKTRFEEVNDVCLDSSGQAGLRSPFSRRDKEYDLLLGALDFLHKTNADMYDSSHADYVSPRQARERVWEGFQIPNGHYLYPPFYSDGTYAHSGDINNTWRPNQYTSHGHHYNFNSDALHQFTDQNLMRRRFPSGHCFVRAWGNDTSKIVVTSQHQHAGKSRVVCEGRYLSIFSNKYFPSKNGLFSQISIQM